LSRQKLKADFGKTQLIGTLYIQSIGTLTPYRLFGIPTVIRVTRLVIANREM